MKDFIFDLQRFDTKWIAYDSDGNSIKVGDNDALFGDNASLSSIVKLQQDGSNGNKAIKSSKSLTIDLSTYKWQLDTNSYVSVGSGATVTIQNGTLALKVNDKEALKVAEGGSLKLQGGNSTSKLTVSLASGQKLNYEGTTYDADNDLKLTYYGTDDDATEIEGSKFKITKDRTTTQYTTDSSKGLSASISGTSGTKYSTESVSGNTYKLNALSTDSLVSAKLISNGNITISSSDNTIGDPLYILDTGKYSSVYGIIYWTTADAYSLLPSYKTSAPSLKSVKIDNANATVTIDSSFANDSVTIISSGGTSLTSSDNGSNFIVSGSSTVSVEDSKSLNLLSGSIWTATDTQTIAAGSYTVSGYSGGTDGIIVSRNNTTVLVSDIDVGESFNIGNGTYTNKSGLGLVTNDKIYAGTVTAESGAYSINLSELTGNMKPPIAPNDGVLVLGGSHTQSAVVVNKEKDFTVKYADLNVASGNYTLTTVAGRDSADFQTNVTKISVAGGSTTIDSVLGVNKTISTAQGTSFIVTKTSGNTFNLNGTELTPTIGGATGLTLIDGPIKAANSQTVTLGTNGKEFKFTGNSVTIVASETASNYSVDASASNSLAIADKNFSIDSSSDGMTFISDSNGNVTLSGLSTKNKDAFTYSNATYHVYDQGFFQKTSDTYKIYNGTGNHSLSNGTITASDLTVTNNWLGILAVDTAKAVTIPTTLTDSAVVLDTVGFANTYGTVTASGNAYTLTTDNDRSKLSAINLGSTATALTASLTGMKISTSAATLSVTQDDSDKGYQVTLSGGAVSVGGASDVSLIGGKAQFDSLTTYHVNNSVFAALGSSDIDISVNGFEVTIGGLSKGESFSIGGTSYTLLSNGRFERSGGSVWKADTISNGSVTFASLTADSNWYGVAPIGASGIVTIEDNVGISSNSTVYVVDETSGAAIIYGTLGYDGTTYTLNNTDKTNDVSGININGGDKNLSLASAFVNKSITAGDTTFKVTQSTSSAYTVNYKSSEVSVGDATAISLSAGTLTLSNTSQTVTANGTQIIAGESSTITATNDNGTVTIDLDSGEGASIGGKAYKLTSGDGINVSISSGTMTVTDINQGDVFTIGEETFTRTDSGFIKTSGSNHYLWKDSNGASLSSATLTNLTSTTSWTQIIDAPSGVLTINTSVTASPLKIVDLPSVTTATSTNYGTLTLSGGSYNLTRTSDDSILSEIELVGKKIVLPADLASTTITVGDGNGNTSFSVNTSSNFTVDATSTYPAISNVNSVNLKSGTLLAAVGTPIIAGSKTVTATKGDMTVGIGTDGRAFVGELNTGDTFTVDGVSYEVTAAGLFDAANKKLVQGVTTTYYLDVPSLDIIAVSGTTLDISNQKTDALVYDSVKNPTTFLATLTIGSALELKGESSAASKIKTVKIAAATDLNVDFATAVEMPSGTATINGETYHATTKLTLDSNGSTSTLYAGTVKLDSGTSTLTATNDPTLEVLNGNFNATAAKGSLTKLTNLDAGDSFSYDGKTYTQSALGLVTGSTLAESLKGSSLNVDAIASATFTDIIAADNNTLNLNAAKTALVVDSLTNPTKKYGNLTVSNGAYTLNFAIDATASGTVTVNGQTYKASGTITLKTTATTSMLYDGTVNLAAGDSVTADKTVTLISGNATATAKSGKFATIDGLDVGESFTYDGTTYTQTSLGLTTDGTICTDLTGTSIDLSKLSSANWTGFIAPVDGVINLADVKQTSTVVDDLISTTNTLGTLTKNGTTYTTDFAIKLSASGNVTVNGKSYDANGSITLTTTAATSTLTDGTVNLAEAQSVTTTSGKTVTASDGDISVTVGTTITIGDLDLGDSFKIDGTSYSLTAAGLVKDDSYLCTEKTSSSVTLDTLGSDVWSPVVIISNGALDVTSSLSAGLIISDDFTKIYGTLGKSSGVYTLSTASNANATLSSICADGVKLQIAPDFVNVPLSSANAKFSNLALTTSQENFTLDDTGNAAVLGNVKSFTLNEGFAALNEGQIAKNGSNSVTATSGNFTLDALSLAAIDSGDTFTLNGTAYTLSALGLMSGNKLVTGGYGNSTLTFADLELSPLIAPANGIINLANVKETSAVVDSLSNPTKLLGTLTKDGTTYTADFATNLLASGNVTVNDKYYSADGSITLATTAKTSTLKSGTVNLTVNQSVTTTSGDTVAVTSGESTVIVTDSAVKISAFSNGDEFTLNGDVYKVSAVGPINSEGKLWTGKAYANGLTTTELADADNWKTMFSVKNGDLYIDANTLANGDDVVLVDDETTPTKIYGTLDKSKGEYNLTDDNATEPLNSITIDKAAANIDNDLYKVSITTISTDGTESTFTVTPSGESDSFLVDSSKATTDVERVTGIDISKGKVIGGDGTIVRPTDGAEGVSILLDNGKHTVGDEGLTISGLEEGSTIEAKIDSDGNITDFVGMEKGSTITIDGTTYTAPEDNSTLHYSEEDGWYFENYELDAYTVTVEKKGTVIVDPGVKLTDVVGSGKQSSGSVEISADLDDVPVTVVNTSKSALKVTDEDGTLIEGIDRGSTATVQRKIDEIIITADEGNSMTLTAEDYIINGVKLTTSGSTRVEATADGVEIDLSKSAAVTYGNKTISGTGTVELSADGNVLVEGTVKIGDVTFNSDELINTSIASGLSVKGDTVYQVNVEGGKLVSLESIGGNVTLSGASNLTVTTNGAGTFTADKTFTADSGTTYTIANGKITAAEVTDTIGGDFSGGLTVNDNPVTVKGGNATVSADGDIQTAAGSYTVNGHAFTASNATTFNTEDGKVNGVEISGGNLVVKQNETDFKINDETLTLANNTTPVSLGVANGKVTSASGVNGSIDGLEDATVYNAGKATINGKKLNVSGTCAAVVVDGEAVGLVGVESGTTIKTAPDMTIELESGNYTIGSSSYNINDTVDGSCKIETDSKTGVSDIENFAGSISGAVGAVTLNGKDFGTNNGAVTVSSDGKNITGVTGIKSGDSIGGDLDAISFTLPEGTVTINDNKLKLEGEESAQVSNGGKTITGLTKDASLSASKAGGYRVNGRTFTASGAASFTVNRDGAYKINDNFLPIIETTPSSLVTSRGYTLKEKNGTVSGDKIAVRGDAKVTVPVDNTNIIATSGSVTLQNYSENATIQTYEYTNLGNAIMNNLIQFGNGIMTLGDAVITYTEKASSNGATINKLLNAVGSDLLMGFTYTAGGKIDLSNRTENAMLKGNYAAKNGDTQKSGASELKTGEGNDTLLIGGGDSVDAGAGSNTIYITDSRLRNAAATIYLNEGNTRVVNFNGGFNEKSDKIVISDVTDLNFSYTNTQFVISTGGAQMMLYNLATSADLVTSADMVEESYKFKLTDGRKTYNTAVAKDGKDILVSDSEEAILYFGNDSGVSFSEYSGAVRVNLSEGTGALKGTSAQFQGINKLEGGKGNSTLYGASGEQNTLIAGTGDASLWSNSGADLMVGKTNKSGTTTFYFLADDGRDTITGFEFATSADAGDFIDITKANAVTDVWLEGSDVIMQINESSYDYLRLVGAKGKDFRINNLMAKVDDNLDYDANVNCYVAEAGNATLTIDSNVGDSDIWLNDNVTGLHGKYYLGDIKYLDATAANGSNILAGNALNNVIYGGKVANSLWGGYGDSQDTLIGGKGQNTFYFAAYNGNDIVQNAHDGDVIDLTTLKLIDIAATTITAGGAVVEVVDGSKINVQSNASIEYRLSDGTYTANHVTGEWIKK